MNYHRKFFEILDKTLICKNAEMLKLIIDAKMKENILSQIEHSLVSIW